MRNDTTQKVFEVIKEYISVHGYAPSYQEIGDAVGLKSKASINYHVNKLIRLGYLETDLNYESLSPRAYRLGRKANERI